MIDADTYVYTKHSGNKMVMISLYVDDLLIASNDKNLLLDVKKSLNKRFEMKDLGSPNMSRIGVRLEVVC